MNVLLVNPPTSNLFAQVGINLPPLGLAYLAAVLRNAGHRVRFANKLKPETVQFFILTPYPGTALFEQVARENRILHRHWEFYDGAHAVIETNNLKPKELQRLFAQAYFKFYLNLRYMFRSIKNILQNKNPIRMSLKAIDFTISLFLQLRKASKNE